MLTGDFNAVVDYVGDNQLFMASGLSTLWPFCECVRVYWKLRSDDLVDYLSNVQSVSLFENGEDVGMRKPSILEFHHILTASSSAHDIGIDEKIQKISLHKIEHSCHNIRPVLWLMAGKEEVSNLWPQRIYGKGDE